MHFKGPRASLSRVRSNHMRSWRPCHNCHMGIALDTCLSSGGVPACLPRRDSCRSGGSSTPHPLKKYDMSKVYIYVRNCQSTLCKHSSYSCGELTPPTSQVRRWNCSLEHRARGNCHHASPFCASADHSCLWMKSFHDTHHTERWTFP